MISTRNKLLEKFYLYSDLTALYVKNSFFNYSEILKISELICNEIHVKFCSPIMVYGDRTLASYTGVIASVLAECPYVPLNSELPPDRLRKIIELSSSKVIIVSRPSVAKVKGILNGYDIKIISVDDYGAVSCEQSLLNSEQSSRIPGLMKDFAYLMFTSGSTGVPKGILVTRENLDSYIENIQPYVMSKSNSRFTQLFDLSFDLSVHDMFVCWNSGASLYVVPAEEKFLPDAFVKKHGITHWFSVPSVSNYLRMFGRLKVGNFPSLENVMFCGEALSVESAKLWSYAAENARIYNLYGPTEATIAFSVFEIDPNFLNCYLEETVPIGNPIGDQEMRISDEDNIGELILSGRQVTHGYLNEPEKTLKVFDFDEPRCYRTGDIVAKSEDYGFLYIGRVDRQIQIQGYRVELNEIEFALEKILPESTCAVIYENNKISAFIQGMNIDPGELKTICGKSLPKYMIPEKFASVGQIPLNANGKKDYSALIEKDDRNEIES